MNRLNPRVGTQMCLVSTVKRHASASVEVRPWTSVSHSCTRVQGVPVGLSPRCTAIESSWSVVGESLAPGGTVISLLESGIVS